MIIKEFNTNNYIFIDKNKYVNVKHYYEEGTLILFYVSWCPHSKKTMDQWNIKKTRL